MRITTRADFAGKNPIQMLDHIGGMLETKVAYALKKGVQAVKRHLVAMTSTRLVKRSGALHREISGAVVGVKSGGLGAFEGTLTVTGISKNKRGESVRKYLNTHFGKGEKTITSKGKMLAIPIQGGPAWTGAAPTRTPATMPGIMVRIGQVLYAGKGKSRDLSAAFILRPYVIVPRRVNPQDAVDEAQMEILSNFQGLVGSVNK